MYLLRCARKPSSLPREDKMPPGTKRRKTEDCCLGNYISGSPRYVTRLFLRERHASGIESIGPYFGSLPPEMLNLLFSYLDAPALSSLGATCRVLDSYAKRMWKPLCARLGLAHKPTVLCVANPLSEASVFSYDKAVELCRGEKRWEIMAMRSWLYSKWRCVVCYRNCSHRVDVHFDVTLCDGCHPLFYRRKCHAKVCGGSNLLWFNIIRKCIAIPLYLTNWQNYKRKDRELQCT